MAKSLFIDSERRVIIERIRSLKPEAQPQWGRMDVRQALTHIAFPLKTAMGCYPATPEGKAILTTKLMKNFIIYVMPWPKGKIPTAPEYNMVFMKKSGPEFPVAVEELIGTIEQFAKLPEDFSFTEHPAFGDLTRKQWGSLQHKHLGHHLQQFGA